VPPGLGVARRQLQDACTRNDPAAAHRALLAWAQARWPDAGSGAWRELCAACGPALRREIEALDRALYGRQAQAWSGTALWRSYSADAPAPAAPRKRPPALAPLHP
jgi:hypothetical protein